MASTMIRVPAETHRTIRQLVDVTGETMQQVVATAIEEYRRKLFWEKTNASYAALREDPTAWQEELDERAAWDASLSDGVEPE